MVKTSLSITVIAALALMAPVANAAPGHLEGYVPSAAHAAGKFESVWTTDLWIYNQGATTIHLWFNRAGGDNTEVESVLVRLDEPVTRFTDVVANLFGSDGIGSIHYLADGPVTITSRTWTAAQNGGSYGQTIAGVPLELASSGGLGQAGTLRVVADKTPEFRSNLGLVNVTGVPVSVAVEIFNAAGDLASGNTKFSVALDPYGMTQINDVLKRVDDDVALGTIIRVGVTSEQGAAMIYLSTVDNTTNDASYQEGFRFGF